MDAPGDSGLDLALRHPEYDRDIEMFLGSCRPFATDSSFSHEMNYLTSAGYIRKMGPKGRKVPYEITEYGKAQLNLLRNRRSEK